LTSPTRRSVSVDNQSGIVLPNDDGIERFSDQAANRAAEKGHELASHHSITSSARSKVNVGNSMPIALAVLRGTTNSYLFGCYIGISPPAFDTCPLSKPHPQSGSKNAAPVTPLE
jgi:hypothetical protein